MTNQTEPAAPDVQKNPFENAPWRHAAVDGGWDGVVDSEGRVICVLKLNEPSNATKLALAPAMFEALERALPALDALAYASKEGAAKVKSQYPDGHRVAAESQRVADQDWQNAVDARAILQAVKMGSEVGRG